MKRLFIALLLAMTFLLGACATKQDAASPENLSTSQTEQVATTSVQTDDFDEEFEDEFDSEYDEIRKEAESISDPFEPWNRFWFGFNDILYMDVLDPLHSAYRYVMPEFFRDGFVNVAHNIAMPIRFANALLQGNVGGAVVELGTFLVNSFVGLGGFFDVTAEKELYIDYVSENSRFGTTLAIWGVPPGPYLVWPFLGPSSVRQTLGFAGDMLASPFTWIEFADLNLSDGAGYGVQYGLLFNAFDEALYAYEMLTKNAVEPYVAMREAYLPSLHARIERLRKQSAERIAKREAEMAKEASKPAK